MPEPLARDEDRAADVEAEGVVLERRAVALAHEEADQARVARRPSSSRRGEADTRAALTTERSSAIARVETDEAVVEDGDRAVGYHFGA